MMLNTGAYQNDIAELRRSEVDWSRGTIRRARSKTRERGGPVVTYKLWPETFALLEKYRSEGERVLTTGARSPGRLKVNGTRRGPSGTYVCITRARVTLRTFGPREVGFLMLAGKHELGWGRDGRAPLLSPARTSGRSSRSRSERSGPDARSMIWCCTARSTSAPGRIARWRSKRSRRSHAEVA